ncbi:MAG: hypothetical protein A2X36_11395 [Elusimicrobia bacterium GWA2_69_24]|nr:MAG: hypothetical protein A2X36_11395 [Elusimicrobia bacterium GWA2_69_24]HBL17200.1 spermidine/putrescine ABC transporter permease [Elusimicrobiota bacterium]
MRVPARVRLLAPPLAWIGVFYVVPLLLILAVSFVSRGAYGGVSWTPNWGNYGRIFDSLYGAVFFRSIVLSTAATAACALLAFPVSWWMARSPKRSQETLLLLVLIPFWTNILVRLYAWMFLLSGAGLLNSALQALGLTRGPVDILYTRGAILLGLLYGNLPLMILPLYASLERIDKSLLEAARDLYASPAQTLFRVILPLAKPGLAAGCILVFTSALCDFATPDLLGGAKNMLVGNLIQQQYLVARDWPFGSALSLTQMLVIGGGLLLFRRLEKAA